MRCGCLGRSCMQVHGCGDQHACWGCNTKIRRSGACGAQCRPSGTPHPVGIWAGRLSNQEHWPSIPSQLMAHRLHPPKDPQTQNTHYTAPTGPGCGPSQATFPHHTFCSLASSNTCSLKKNTLPTLWPKPWRWHLRDQLGILHTLTSINVFLYINEAMVIRLLTDQYFWGRPTRERIIQLITHIPSSSFSNLRMLLFFCSLGQSMPFKYVLSWCVKETILHLFSKHLAKPAVRWFWCSGHTHKHRIIRAWN